jgi:hypothetical protein
MWCQQLPKIVDNPRQSCLRRPDSVQLPTVPATLQKVIESGAAREGMRFGTFPLWANAR